MSPSAISFRLHTSGSRGVPVRAGCVGSGIAQTAAAFVPSRTGAATILAHFAGPIRSVLIAMSSNSTSKSFVTPGENDRAPKPASA
jgi:hypothetical protein